MSNPYSADNYTDGRNMTAKQKARFMRAFDKFIADRIVSSDAGAASFTQAIYHHLSQYCGYIAHYNREGFYSAQFANYSDFVRNMRRWAHGLGGYEASLSYPALGDLSELQTEIQSSAARFLLAAEARLRQLQEQHRAAQLEQAKALLEGAGYTVNEVQA